MEPTCNVSGTAETTVTPSLSAWKCEKILVVVDPTAEQHACIEKAMLLALRYRSSVELFICDNEEAEPESLASAPTALEYRRHLRQRRIYKLEGLAGPLRAAGLTVSTYARWEADLAAGIVHHAIRTQADLVVKDTHHHIPMPRFAMRPTDTTLIRQLPAALLLVRSEPWSSTPRLTAAIDPTQPAERSAAIDEALVDAASSLSNKLLGVLDVVHVLRDPPHFPDESVTKEQRDRAHARSRAQVSGLVKLRDPTAIAHFLDGPVAKSLLGFIAQHQPDIMVMGAAARQRWLNAVAGGTAAELLEYMNCDLLVIKQPGFVSGLLTTESTHEPRAEPTL